MGKRSAAVYIDGFNFYNGSLKAQPALKWLDVVGLADDLLRSHDVRMVRFYTARVDNTPSDPGMSQRQDAYLRALRAHRGDRLEIVYGKFQTHKRRMPLVRPLQDGSAFVQVWRREEKGSDVNLAAQVVWDACHGLYDDICIVSNDSDLQAPVDMAMKLGRAVITVNPHVHKRQRDSLVGSDVRRLSLGRLSRNLLPDPVTDPSTGRPVSCPHSWRP